MVLAFFPFQEGIFHVSFFLFLKEKSQFKVHIEHHWRMGLKCEAPGGLSPSSLGSPRMAHLGLLCPACRSRGDLLGSLLKQANARLPKAQKGRGRLCPISSPHLISQINHFYLGDGIIHAVTPWEWKFPHET